MFVNKPISTDKGLTFIEVLIALTINVILLSALLAVFTSNIGHYNRVIYSDTLNQQLQIALNLMANDIRRAGYWANANNDISTGQNNNPYMAGTNDLTITGGNCIQFSYDRSSNGTLPAISSSIDDERYGFRLTNQILQTRPPGANQSCTSAATTWENVTDPNTISITNLAFTLTQTTLPIGQTSKTMLVRTVNISITGQLVSDATITKTLTQQVRIRNDKFVP